jgi:hypothetical protein
MERMDKDVVALGKRMQDEESFGSCSVNFAGEMVLGFARNA